MLGIFSLTEFPNAPISDTSRSPRASPETSQSRSGMRRPACMARNRAPGRRPSNTAHPPLRADRANAARRSQRTPPRQATSEGIAQAGSGPKNRRGGAPRGERPPARGLRKLICAGTRAGLREWLRPQQRVPLHPSACRRSASLTLREGRLAKLGGGSPRENGDACACSRIPAIGARPSEGRRPGYRDIGAVIPRSRFASPGLREAAPWASKTLEPP